MSAIATQRTRARGIRSIYALNTLGKKKVTKLLSFLKSSVYDDVVVDDVEYIGSIDLVTNSNSLRVSDCASTHLCELLSFS